MWGNCAAFDNVLVFFVCVFLCLWDVLLAVLGWCRWQHHSHEDQGEAVGRGDQDCRPRASGVRSWWQAGKDSLDMVPLVHKGSHDAVKILLSLPFKALEEAQQAIQELFGRIRNIKAKAEHSELMVKFSPLNSPQTLLVFCIIVFTKLLVVRMTRCLEWLGSRFPFRAVLFTIEASVDIKSLFIESLKPVSNAGTQRQTVVFAVTIDCRLVKPDEGPILGPKRCDKSAPNCLVWVLNNNIEFSMLQYWLTSYGSKKRRSYPMYKLL